MAHSPLHAQLKQNKNVVAVKDALMPSLPGAVKINGYVGKRIEQCINNRIMVQPTEPLLDIFKIKGKDPGGYRGEFIGKWLAAASLSNRYMPNQILRQRMEQAATELVNTRFDNGYITTYKAGDEFKVWDVWVQKYVLLGLIAQYEQTGNASFLEGAKKSVDYLIQTHGPGKAGIEESNGMFHKGGSNYSILEPIVLLYEKTADKKYLDFATYIVDSWSKPNKYTKTGVRYIENAEQGVPLVDAGVLHAYEYMSSFEGLCELYRAAGKQRYLYASIKLAHQIMKEELMITGSVSNHEMWYSGTLEQTEMLEKPVETCATATWMKLCYQLLRLTGDSKWADQMEVSLYNSLLGAMMPKGEWWSYDSPLSGERLPSRVQGIDLSCCVSSGPRGLLITPEWAMMTSKANETVINLYSAGTASLKLANNNVVSLIQQTTYPVNNTITIHVNPQRPASFVLKLRIPEWSKQTRLKVNGKEVICKPGTYASISRYWKPNDVVTLELDLRGRIVRAPSGAPQQAVMRGPILLAFDNRLTPAQDSTVWLVAGPQKFDDVTATSKGYVLPTHNFPKNKDEAYIDLKPVTIQNDDILMAFEVPFIIRMWHIVNHHEKKLIMCDYASAGNKWSADNVYRVWLPQPLFMGELYPKNTWNIMYPGAKKRSTVPDYIEKVVKE